MPTDCCTATKKRAREEAVTAVYDSGDDTWEADSDTEVDKTQSAITAGYLTKPLCPYGDKCFRKNPSHFVEYCHPHLPGQSVSPSPALHIGVTIPAAKAKGVPLPLPPAAAPAAKPAAALTLPSSYCVPVASAPQLATPPYIVAPSAAAATPTSGCRSGVCPFGVLCFRRGSEARRGDAPLIQMGPVSLLLKNETRLCFPTLL